MMKKLAYIILLLLFASQSYSQSKVNASASVTIVPAVGATKEADMDFGNFSAGSKAGTISLKTKGLRSTTGEITFLGNSNSQMATINLFTADYAYAVTFPSSGIVVKQKQGSEKMMVTSFTIAPENSKANNRQVTVGATLNVGAGQVSGVYYNDSPFDITVNYN